MTVRDRTTEFIQMHAQGQMPLKKSTSIANLHESTAQEFIEIFLNKVEEIYDIFTYLDKNIAEVMNIESAILEYNETDEKLYSIYSKIKKGLVNITKKLSDLENSFDPKNFDGSSTEIHICNMQILVLKRKISDCISNYYNMQEEYKLRCKAKVKRQAQIVGVELSEKEFDDAVERKTEVFLQTILPEFDITHRILQEIKARHEHLLLIEKSIQELHDIFFDVALIIQEESVIIERIDYCSRTVVKLVAKGRAHIDEVKSRINKISKKAIIFIVVIIIIVIIIIVAVVTSSDKTSKNPSEDQLFS